MHGAMTRTPKGHSLMHLRTRALAAVASLGVAAAATAALPTVATAANPPKVITVTMTKHSISFDAGTSIPAGKVNFTVTSKAGLLTLQLLHLHKGYTKKQAKHDVNAAFGGNLKAIHRVDTRMDWLGGGGAAPRTPGPAWPPLCPAPTP